MNTPTCFNSKKEFKEWLGFAHKSKLTWLNSSGKLDYCVDCTGEYQDEMIFARRCEFPDRTPGKHIPKKKDDDEQV